MVSEDFSFPRMKNSLPHFAVSPSLWRVSSVVYPDVNWEDEEDRMDMLWEDFNEELQRVSSSGNKNNNSTVKSCDFAMQNEQQDLKPSSTNSSPVIQRRNKKKQSFGSVLKAFKMVFSVRKSTQNKIIKN